ncbi:META domain-containing protein [Rubellimicrobium thermophilum]|uniref:META domain-containing protein n=1 Tax=Rubellimicrobium thermophilum TaxID=295419 RepID=UPI003CCC0C8C
MSFAPPVATRIACDTAVMRSEERFFAALAGVAGFDIDSRGGVASAVFFRFGADRGTALTGQTGRGWRGRGCGLGLSHVRAHGHHPDP